MASEAIIFTATVYKVQTLVDGGVRLALDMPEDTIMQMAMLAECQRYGVVLRITAEPEVKGDGLQQKRGKIHI